jgi:SAM-dependent methyltransferase
MTTGRPLVKEMVRRRSTCRLCGSSDVVLVLSLTPTPPVDAYVEEAELDAPQTAFPMDLFACRECGHAQLLDVVDPELLFGNYIYETASSPGLVAHFERYADEAISYSGARPGGFAVDIGSNDGTLLRFFKEHGLRVLGVDPAAEVASRATAAGIETVTSFMNVTVAEGIRRRHGRADIVTANNVFAHADDMGEMADSIRELLAPDGFFFFEVSYLLDMIGGMVFDFIYHEHLCHHSVKPLRAFLEGHGLELVDIFHIPTKGGSLRGVAQLKGGARPAGSSVDAFIEREESAGLYGLEIYENWDSRIEEVRRTVTQQVDAVRERGGTVAAYGASATSTVLIYHFHLGDKLEFIVDDIPERQGRFSPGHHIPVVAADAISDRSPDAILVLAWRFADMIIDKHRDYLSRGGTFLVPLPEPRLISG